MQTVAVWNRAGAGLSNSMELPHVWMGSALDFKD